MECQRARAFILRMLKEELPPHLSYHSVEHVIDVYESCQKIADDEGITGKDRMLLLTAALFHDSGFLLGPKDHEKSSCIIAEEYLPDFGYSREDIRRICGMIMATRIPQDPKNKLEEILCDADLDYLGRDDFFTIGNKLFAELSTSGILKTEEEWNKLQLRFLQSHHYFTGTAIRLRKSKKEEHLQQIRDTVESY